MGNTARCCVVLAVGAALWSRDWRVAGGVVGGGVLVAVATWAIAGAVNSLSPTVAHVPPADGEKRKMPPVFRGFPLVKFFTRHVILAFVAYVMMVRLHLDPVGMVVGVTSVVIAAFIEAVRPR